jgi:hypothetical protein
MLLIPSPISLIEKKEQYALVLNPLVGPGVFGINKPFL